MAVEKLSENVEIIKNLGDNPNTDDNLSAEELKAKFDEASVILKRYINETLVPFVNTLDSTFSASLDETLTDEKKAAQAKAVGDALKKLLPNSGGTMTGAIAMGGNKITGLGTPTADTDAATKKYADTKLPLAGGTVTGAITVSNDSSSGHVQLINEGEGGTIRVGSKSGTYTYEIDAFNDYQIRLHTHTKHPSDVEGRTLGWDATTGGLWGVGTPTGSTYAVNKAYIDALFPKFRTYTFTYSSYTAILTVLKGIWSTITSGESFLIHLLNGGSNMTLWGVKHDASSGWAVSFHYGWSTGYLFRNYEGTWSETAF